MIMPDKTERKMIVVCGVNCIACSKYLNAKTPCSGCRSPKEEHTRKSCRDCLITECASEKELDWCFECDKFPCSKIKRLNKRYMTNYNVDLVKNGLDAKSNMDMFLSDQLKRFTCDACGSVIDQHHQICSDIISVLLL